jgi:hypothetical protein
MSVKSPLGLVFFVLCCYLNMQAINKTFLIQVKFQILSYKLGLGKSLTGLGLRKFKKPWAWACPTKCSTPEQYL